MVWRRGDAARQALLIGSPCDLVVAPAVRVLRGRPFLQPFSGPHPGWASSLMTGDNQHMDT
jgi:hypothetical protein